MNFITPGFFSCSKESVPVKMILHWKHHLTSRYQEISIHRTKKAFQNNKIGCILPMIIWSKFRFGKYRDEDHREDASHFGSLWQQIEEQDFFFLKTLPENSSNDKLHWKPRLIWNLKMLKITKNYEQGTQKFWVRTVQFVDQPVLARLHLNYRPSLFT